MTPTAWVDWVMETDLTVEFRNGSRIVLAAVPRQERAKGNSTNRAADGLATVIEHACRKYGAKWPRTLAGELVKHYGVTKQAISSRKKTALRHLEQEVAA